MLLAYPQCPAWVPLPLFLSWSGRAALPGIPEGRPGSQPELTQGKPCRPAIRTWPFLKRRGHRSRHPVFNN